MTMRTDKLYIHTIRHSAEKKETSVEKWISACAKVTLGKILVLSLGRGIKLTDK